VLTASIRGLVIAALSRPEIGAQRLLIRPFEATEPREWGLPALSLAALATSFIEPDPDIARDDERLNISCAA
jgi:hypothetical protein